MFCLSTPLMGVGKRQRPSYLEGSSWPQPEEAGPYLSVPQLQWDSLSACLILSTGRQDPAHTAPSFCPGSQLLSALFKAKRCGGLKAFLSQVSSWSLRGHGPDSIPYHSVRLLEPKMLRFRYRKLFTNFPGSCVSVSFWPSFCLLGEKGARGYGWGSGGKWSHKYPPPFPSGMASCLHDQEHCHWGGPKLTWGGPVGYLLTTGEIWVCWMERGEAFQQAERKQ